jgi:hypothetical protein
MRRFLATAAIAGALLAPAGAAWAQAGTTVRDPFDPLIQPSPAATATDPTVPLGPTVPTIDPAPDPDEPLPGTGSQTATWTGLGYVLVALGAGAVAVSRLFAPVRAPAR